MFLEAKLRRYTHSILPPSVQWTLTTSILPRRVNYRNVMAKVGGKFSVKASPSVYGIPGQIFKYGRPCPARTGPASIENKSKRNNISFSQPNPICFFFSGIGSEPDANMLEPKRN